jgi:hypothetical protein
MNEEELEQIWREYQEERHVKSLHEKDERIGREFSKLWVTSAG